MNAVVRVTSDGRIELPVHVVKALGLQPDDTVTVALDGKEIWVSTIEQSVNRAQALSRRLLAGRPGSSVDDFLKRRREDMGE